MNVAERERFYEEITKKAVADTVEKLLKYPFGFHGDTGIQNYLYARLLDHGGEWLKFDDPDRRPGFSTILLQVEQITRIKYSNTGGAGGDARFDLALTLPPGSADPIEDRFATNLLASIAVELGKNKAVEEVVDKGMFAYAPGSVIGTSDVSKLYLELKHEQLRQGWAIEFYDSLLPGGKRVIGEALETCRGLNVEAGKKLVVVFVGFSHLGEHYVASNDVGVQAELIALLAENGTSAGSDLASYASQPAPPYRGSGWGSQEPSASPEDVFADRAEFAERIIQTGGMQECGRKSRYVNLSCAGKKNIAQIHPQPDGIALVLRSQDEALPETRLERIPVADLVGYAGANKAWLDGTGRLFERKGPAVAFLIPDAAAESGPEDWPWQDVSSLLEHAKTLA